ncbi:MAG: 3-phosphoshikimate 1-carboxyvinyltransferase, partial [Anaerolineae bacterium]
MSLHATVRVPGSKSLTNRALLLAALGEGTTRLSNALFSDDTHYFAQALKDLGFAVHLDEVHSEMSVTGLGGRIPAHRADLFVGNAGTAARFLTAFLTLGEGEFTLDGDARMRERPIGDLVIALQQLGAHIEALTPATDPSFLSLPLKIYAQHLPGGRARVRGDISSQFLSALLMTAPYAQSTVEIRLTTALHSKPYVAMTLAVMRDFGVEIESGDDVFRIAPARYSSPGNYTIESDASAASYFFAAPAICGGTLRVENITRRSRQGDIAFLDVLAQMGCEIREGNDYLEVSAGATLRGVDVDMSDIPDTAQTLAAIAPFATSPTRIRGIASARFKETDRIHATCTELTRLGVKVEEHPDGMTIYPCRNILPAAVQTYNDHRMA